MALELCPEGHAIPTWANGICHVCTRNERESKRYARDGQSSRQSWDDYMMNTSSSPRERFGYVIDELDELISKGGGSTARSMRKTALSIIETMEEMEDNGIPVPTDGQKGALENISKAVRKWLR